MALPTSGQHPGFLPLDRCPFTVEGIGSVVHYLRTHPYFANQDEARLQAMAIAFLAFGGTDDDNHSDVPPGELHPSHFAVHKVGQSGWPGHIRKGYIQTVIDLVCYFSACAGSPVTNLWYS